ncbi:D-methionine transport system ATP-binding protein [Mucilaginibacter mallensis]|uniref:D-methionine transport system ATP-binding protein n=1 Tax=Mucilaginibacter mallensis TaxID=652787 RepID=A0A1H1MLW1_MUCMA|nr:methionine ABC transporter ATP-binding protein MetN [Mucilaginibacter mallensis]SDR87632.1 D-methionine transport system ATP-binding protein [Mucilaginibacter mallensis]
MIELRNITKTFYKKNSQVSALSNVSLIVPKGKILGVIGASGAGKSTLIRCVNLLERPTSGEVIIGGLNLTQLAPSALAKARREIGMIFQHFNLLSSRTVAGNVAFPLELSNRPGDEIKKRVAELLELVGLGDKANEYPANLSGGQKQRVAIARTLANNPRVLLCDEATSALDPATTLSILNLLKDINKRFQITILLITHEMNVVKAICDEVAIISEGKLIERGSISEVFAYPETTIAKQFIASSLHATLPAEYEQRLSATPAGKNHPVIKLEFNGHSAEASILSEASRMFQVDNNIISAQMDYTGGVKYGVMLIEVTGSKKDTQNSLEYYRSKHIEVEVLGYV